MTKLSDRVSKLMANPKTKEMINKAKVAANKPENREKLSKMSDKISGKMRKSDSHGAHSHGAHSGQASPADRRRT